MNPPDSIKTLVDGEGCFLGKKGTMEAAVNKLLSIAEVSWQGYLPPSTTNWSCFLVGPPCKLCNRCTQGRIAPNIKGLPILD